MADPIVWGLLPKAQDDPTTIDEAINAAIAAHEASPDSHLGDGESLANHRENTTIDHPAGSVAGDKFSAVDFALIPNFESLDRYSHAAATLNAKLGTIDIFTNTTSNNRAYFFAPGASGAAVYDPLFETTFQFSLTLFTGSAQEIYAGVGGLSDDDGPPFAGFKIVNDTLYICEQVFGDEGFDEYTTEITGIDPNAQHFYRVHVVPDENVLEFYVDNNLVGTLTPHTNSDSGLTFFSFSVKTTNTTAKQIRFGSVYFSRAFPS